MAETTGDAPGAVDLDALAETMRGWRQHLHRNPEFGFEEVETARFVAERLREFGIDEIETGGDPAAWDAGTMAEDFAGEAMHYRAFWYTLRDRGPILMGIGIHGQNLLIDRKAGLVLARHSSHPMPLDTMGETRLLSLFQRIRDALSHN